MPSIHCVDCDSTGQRKKLPGIFQLPAPCPTCLGSGLVPTDRNEELKARVRKLRTALHYSWRTIADIIHQEFKGCWHPHDSQVVGESLCAEAGIDRSAEFLSYCRRSREEVTTLKELHTQGIDVYRLMRALISGARAYDFPNLPTPICCPLCKQPIEAVSQSHATCWTNNWFAGQCKCPRGYQVYTIKGDLVPELEFMEAMRGSMPGKEDVCSQS